MKKNYDKKTGLYKFVKVNNVEDITNFTDKDISKPVFFDEETVSKFVHIKENLYQFDNDFYIPSNY